MNVSRGRFQIIDEFASEGIPFKAIDALGSPTDDLEVKQQQPMKTCGNEELYESKG
jgi:hypothetical protein